ncbi:MAG: 30S ribosomal protein S9 [Patescibacteria group bacterium]
MVKTTGKKQHYFEAVGRRKNAVCRVRFYLVEGKETAVAGVTVTKSTIMVNNKDASVYFPGTLAHKMYMQPLELTSSVNRFAIICKAVGGGNNSQLDAFRLGISRALEKVNAEYRLILKPHNLLATDPRVRQRRMAGMAGKSRAKRQSPKR